jgi:hypothetical protein
MSREVVIQSWCDVCQSDDIRTPATFSPQLIIGGKPVEIDLCDGHATPVVSVLDDIERFGRRPNGAPGRAPVSDSFVCDLCQRDFPTKQGLTMHKTRTHNVRPR